MTCAEFALYGYRILACHLLLQHDVRNSEATEPIGTVHDSTGISATIGRPTRLRLRHPHPCDPGRTGEFPWILVSCQWSSNTRPSAAPGICSRDRRFRTVRSCEGSSLATSFTRMDRFRSGASTDLASGPDCVRVSGRQCTPKGIRLQLR